MRHSHICFFSLTSSKLKGLPTTNHMHFKSQLDRKRFRCVIALFLGPNVFIHKWIQHWRLKNEWMCVADVEAARLCEAPIFAWVMYVRVVLVFVGAREPAHHLYSRMKCGQDMFELISGHFDLCPIKTRWISSQPDDLNVPCLCYEENEFSSMWS